MIPENREIYEAFRKKLQTETVFFINTFVEAAIRSVPGGGYFVKFKGKKEFHAKKGSTVVTEGILEYKEITEKDYHNF